MKLDLEMNRLIVTYDDGSIKVYYIQGELRPIDKALLDYTVLDSGGEIKTEKAATPVATPEEGAVDSGTTVALSCETTGADIYYTIDGTTPTKTSTKYTTAITISADTTIKAIAIAKNYFDSDILTAVYTVKEQVATPVATPVAGTYDAVQSVALSCETDNATIYYTTDGSTPTAESTEYAEAISVGETLTIKAIAVADEMTDSEVLTAAYTINLAPVATPTADPVAGTYDSVQSVELASATDGATIYYTLDGTTPTAESTEYTSAIAISETTTIKAIAVKSGMTDSEVLTSAYTINLTPVATPTLTFLVDGEEPPVLAENANYSGFGDKVNVECETTGATIYYTLDGSTPTTSSTVYTQSGIAIPSFEGSLTVKVMAAKAGMANSEVVSRTFAAYLGSIAYIDSFSPEPGGDPIEASSDIEVGWTNPGSAEEGATIYYTYNGTHPDAESESTYSGNYISAPSSPGEFTLKVVGAREGYRDSGEITAYYTVA